MGKLLTIVAVLALLVGGGFVAHDEYTDSALNEKLQRKEALQNESARPQMACLFIEFQVDAVMRSFRNSFGIPQPGTVEALPWYEQVDAESKLKKVRSFDWGAL